MEKFRLLADHLRHKGLLTPANSVRPGSAKRELLAQAHCPAYIDRIIDNGLSSSEERRMGLPWSQGLVRRSCISPVGTLHSAHLALEHGIACHLAGGTHHAHYDYGSGFCVFNDLAVTARALLARDRVQRLLIFDCDVHQGDGTAALLADEPRAFTCSIHCRSNFPPDKKLSDMDVELPSGTADDHYLQTVEDTLAQALARARPELVLYDAGVDIYTGDPLGRLDISLAGIRTREELVLGACHRRGIPVATVIGGGYDDDRQALARRHAQVVEAAFAVAGCTPR